ncbi:MAG: hypothetical protein NVV57_04375 [Demequina sp.]|nr:hypothetical protein [Demequina sp.]
MTARPAATAAEARTRCSGWIFAGSAVPESALASVIASTLVMPDAEISAPTIAWIWGSLNTATDSGLQSAIALTTFPMKSLRAPAVDKSGSRSSTLRMAAMG